MPDRKLRAPAEDREMVEYRVYTVDRDGHILRVKALICADDAEAIDQAKRLVIVDHAVELWSGARLVTRLRVETK
jgi:hypothetical protein